MGGCDDDVGDGDVVAGDGGGGGGGRVRGGDEGVQAFAALDCLLWGTQVLFEPP